MEEDSYDSFGIKVPKKIIHLAGHFLEKNERLTTEKKKGYDLSKKVTYFFRENILYPRVNIQEGKRGLTLSMTDYTDILLYIEKTGYSHL